MWIMTETRNIVTGLPTVVARVNRECWRMWTRGIRPAVVGDEDEHALLLRGAGRGTRVAFDHALGCQKIFDLFTKHGNIIVLLEPIGPLLAEAEALEAQTDASFTTALCIWAFVAFLAADSASIAARLGAYRAFCLGRSGLLGLLLLWWNRRD